MAVKNVSENVVISLNAGSEALDDAAQSTGNMPITVDDNSPDVIIAGLSLVDTLQVLSADDPGDPPLGRYRIEPDRVVPFYTVKLQNTAIPSLKELLQARKLESQLDDDTMEWLYSVANGEEGNPDLIAALLAQVAEQIEDAEKMISAVEGLKLAYEQISDVYPRWKLQDEMTALWVKNTKKFGLDPISAIRIEGAADYQRAMNDFTSIKLQTLLDRSSSGLYIQALSDAEWSTYVGISPSMLLNPESRSAKPSDNNRTTSHPWSSPAEGRTKGLQAKHPKLKSLNSMGIGSDPNYEGIFGKNPHSKMVALQDVHPMKRVEVACCQLSREFLLSAGLGRLAGTSLGALYGPTVGRNALRNLFGASAVKWVSNTTMPPRALTNIIIADANGDFDAAGSDQWRVFVLEDLKGYNANKHITTGKREWVDSIKRRPFTNTMGVYDTVLAKAMVSFGSAEEYLTTLYCRDAERVLTTPRGLFVRILKDFSSYLETVTTEADHNIKRNALGEMAMLKLIGDRPPVDGTSQSTIRRRLTQLTILEGIWTRAATLGLDSAETRGSSILGAGDAPMLRFSGLDAQSINSLTPKVEGIKKDLAQAIITSCGDFTITGYKQQLRTGKQIVNTFADIRPQAKKNLEGIIIAIFEDLQAEAATLAQTDDESGTYLRPGATTRFSGWDGAITIAMILNCFVDLVQTFVDTALAVDKTGFDVDSDALEAEVQAAARQAMNEIVSSSTTREGPSEGDFDFSEFEKDLAVNFTDNRTGRIEIRRREVTIRDGLRRFGEWETVSVVEISRPDVVSIFLSTKHRVYHKGGYGSNNRTNRARKFLKELAAASDRDDLSTLIDSQNKVPSVTGLSANADLSAPSTAAWRPSSLIAQVQRLALEDDIPLALFSVAKTFVESLQQNSRPLSQKAAALRGEMLDNEPEDAAILREMQAEASTREFLRSMSDMQIKWAKKRAQLLKGTSDSTYLTNKTNPSMFRAYQMLLDKRHGEFLEAAIMFVGLPNSSVEKELLDKGWAAHESSIKLTIDKVDAATPGLRFDPIEREFFVNVNVREESVSAAFELAEPPENFDDLLNKLRYDVSLPAGAGSDYNRTPLTGAELLDRSRNPTRTRSMLVNELESFLLKAMYQATTGFAFREECVQLQPLGTRSVNTLPLAEELGKQAGLPSNVVPRFFRETLSADDRPALSFPTRAVLGQLMQPQSMYLSGAQAWATPLLDPARASLLYNACSTRPFFVDNVNDLVFSSLAFDRVVAVFVDLHEFAMDSDGSSDSHDAWNERRALDGVPRSLPWVEVHDAILRAEPTDWFSMPSLYVAAELFRAGQN